MTPRGTQRPHGDDDMLEAGCDGMLIRSGRQAGRDANERRHDEHCIDRHRIDAPGMHAAAVVRYRDAGGAARQVRVSDRHVCIIPAGHAHAAEWTHNARLTSILLQPAFLRALARANGEPAREMAAHYASVDPFLWHMARAIEQQLRQRRALEKSYVEAVAVVVGQHLLSTYAETPLPAAPPGGLPRYKLRRAIDYIRAHCHEDIGFRDIAGQLDMSPFHFARMFKQSTGETPHQCIMRCRIDAAKKLLIDGDRGIADIAFEVGYKSQSYFTTRFALLVGVTPAAFRGAR
jgi:AraC family transcriptional regulator